MHSPFLLDRSVIRQRRAIWHESLENYRQTVNNLAMVEEKKNPSAWTSTLAIAGLAVSLFGNIVQYESLKAKRVELEQKNVELQQSQAKIDAANQAVQRRQDSIASQLNTYRKRMDEIDNGLREAEDDNKRAQVGRALGKPEDQQYANDLLQDSISRHTSITSLSIDSNIEEALIFGHDRCAVGPMPEAVGAVFG